MKIEGHLSIAWQNLTVTGGGWGALYRGLDYITLEVPSNTMFLKEMARGVVLILMYCTIFISFFLNGVIQFYYIVYQIMV